MAHKEVFCRVCENQIEYTRLSRRWLYCSPKCSSVAQNRKWRAANKEKIANRNKLYNADVPRKIYIRIKSKCKKLSIPFNLDLSDVVIPDICPVLKMKLEVNRGGRGYWPNSPSLDRIDPAKGYIKGNVRVISARANLLKSDASVEELEAVLADLKTL